MPQPCRQPLSRNPFESYRDPVTGQWKVKYPASALPANAQPLSKSLSESTQSAAQSVEEKIKRASHSHRWKKSSAA